MKNPDQKTIYKITGDTQLLKKEILFFLGFASLFSWSAMLLVWPKISSDFQFGSLKAVEELFGITPLLYGFGPFLSAIIVTLLFRGKKDLQALFRKVIEWRVSVKWYLLALFIPPLLQLIGFLIWNSFAKTSVAWPTFGEFVFSWLQIVMVATLYYISEELGWRGFMQPRFLSFKNVLKSTLALGIIWSVWHYPIWITSTWLTAGSWGEVIEMVLANTFYATSITFFIAWIFQNSNGSILLAMLFHGAGQATMIKLYSLAGDSAVTESSLIITIATVYTVAVLILIRAIFMTTTRPEKT